MDDLTPGSSTRSIRPQRRSLNRNQVRELAEGAWVPPDGGWGWLCVISCFTTLALVVGMSRTYGVIYNDIKEAFPGTKHIEIAFIPSLIGFLTLGLAAVAGALSVAFSVRKVAFAGGLFAALGTSLNFFAMSTLYMQLCSFISGIGAGLACNVGIMMVAKCFNKNRTLALGFAIAGAAVGSTFQPLFLQFLVDVYGFRGALLILGGLLLNVCPGALFYRDPVSKSKLKELKTIYDIKWKASDEETIVFEKSNVCFEWTERHLYLDLELFYSPIFLMTCFSAFFITVGYPLGLVYFPPHAVHLGHSKTKGSLLLSISSVGDFLGRLNGFIFDRNLIKKQTGYIISSILLGTSLIGVGYFKDYFAIAACAFSFGYFAGCVFILLPVLLTENHGVPKLPSSLGIVRSVMAIPCIICPLIAGHIIDISGEFVLTFLILGVFTNLSSIVMCCIIPLKRRRKRSKFIGLMSFSFRS